MNKTEQETRLGEFHEDEAVLLSGRVEKCHFYRCVVVVEGPAQIIDCTFAENIGPVEIVGKDAYFDSCSFGIDLG
jgi:hypothetical protein